MTRINYEDNKMKKDNSATLHCNDNKELLSNIHANISNILSFCFFAKIKEELVKGQSKPRLESCRVKNVRRVESSREHAKTPD